MPRVKLKWQQPAVEIPAPTPNSITPAFLNIEQAAVYFSSTVWTIRRLIKTGKLVAKKPGKRQLIKRVDLDALWESEPACTGKKKAA